MFINQNAENQTEKSTLQAARVKKITYRKNKDKDYSKCLKNYAR